VDWYKYSDVTHRDDREMGKAARQKQVTKELPRKRAREEEHDEEQDSDVEPSPPVKTSKGKQLVISCVTTDKTYRDNTTRYACWAIAYSQKFNRLFLDKVKLMSKEQIYRLFGQYQPTPNSTPDKKGPKGKFVFDDASVKGGIICWDKDQVRIEIGDS
jgi:hypothetical protein